MFKNCLFLYYLLITIFISCDDYYYNHKTINSIVDLTDLNLSTLTYLIQTNCDFKISQKEYGTSER